MLRTIPPTMQIPDPTRFFHDVEQDKPGGSHARRGGADARPSRAGVDRKGARGAARFFPWRPQAHPPAQTRTTAISV